MLQFIFFKVRKATFNVFLLLFYDMWFIKCLDQDSVSPDTKSHQLNDASFILKATAYVFMYLNSVKIALLQRSLTTDIVPSPFKTTAIMPILKKRPGADPSNFNNLHLISNLHFLSKEKLLLNSIPNLTLNNLYEQF